MSTDRDVTRIVQSWLDEGVTQLPDRVLDLVLDQIPATPQRRHSWSAWRHPVMNSAIRISLAAAAVVAIALIGYQLLSGPNVGGPGPSPTPSSSPTLSQSFTSTLHGISVSYPEGWAARAATEPWTDGTFPLSFGVSQVDFLYDPTLTSELFLAIASQPIGDSAPEDWKAEQMASDEGCGTATQPIAVDGVTGLIGADGCTVAVVTHAGRGYWIQLYTGDEAPVTYDSAWFEEVLATVQLDPEAAVD